MNNNHAINDADLENVSGGLIFNASNIAGADPTHPWEVIDNKNGTVLARFQTRDQAVAAAQQYGAGACQHRRDAFPDAERSGRCRGGA